MENYIKVNVQEYVKKGLEDGTMVPFEAFKYKNVLAVQGTVGDEVISWSADSEGNEIARAMVGGMAGGAGNSGIYYANKSLTDDEKLETEITFAIDDIEGDSYPARDDIIINSLCKSD